MNTQTILAKAKQLADESGLSYRQIGERMNYPKKSARQSVYQFLHSNNPGLQLLERFANAMEMDVKDLF